MNDFIACLGVLLLLIFFLEIFAEEVLVFLVEFSLEDFDKHVNRVFGVHEVLSYQEHPVVNALLGFEHGQPCVCGTLFCFFITFLFHRSATLLALKDIFPPLWSFVEKPVLRDKLLFISIFFLLLEFRLDAYVPKT